MPVKKPKRILDISLLPGEPADGSGRVCIHLFVRDEKGSFVEPHVLHQVYDEEGNIVKGQLEAKPTRGRIACNRKLVPNNIPKKGIVSIIFRTDDARGVNCSKCINTDEYKKLATQIEGE